MASYDTVIVEWQFGKNLEGKGLDLYKCCPAIYLKWKAKSETAQDAVFFLGRYSNTET